MTFRARAYLSAVALRHAGIGWYCVIAPVMARRGRTVELLEVVMTLRAWGYLLLVIAAVTVATVASGLVVAARVVLIASATVSGWWSAALVASIFSPGGLGVMPLAVTWVALMAKDLVVAGLPLETPLEDAVERVSGWNR